MPPVEFGQRNAVNEAVAGELKAALSRVEEDPALRVAVLTGAGPVFCAGMDLAAFAAGRRSRGRRARSGAARGGERPRWRWPAALSCHEPVPGRTRPRYGR